MAKSELIDWWSGCLKTEALTLLIWISCEPRCFPCWYLYANETPPFMRVRSVVVRHAQYGGIKTDGISKFPTVSTAVVVVLCEAGN